MALAVANTVYEENLAQLPLPENLSATINELIYDPTY